MNNVTRERSLQAVTNFDWVESEVDHLMLSESSYNLRFEPVSTGAQKIPTIDQFSPYGLTSMAGRIGFPAQGLSVLKDRGSEDIANEIISRFTTEYLAKGKDIFVREFGAKIYGFLSDKYSVFDDDKVVDIIKDSGILQNTESIWYNVNPIHFHARFIDKEKFTVGDDDSPLSMAVFVDNSMVGAAAFKIRFGIYRHEWLHLGTERVHYLERAPYG